MKDLWKSGVVILLIIGVLYILYLRECKRPEPCPPKGQVLLAQSVWDSIKALADKPPVIHIDTVKMKGDVIYVHDQPIPPPTVNPQDTTLKDYADSLVNEGIDVHINLTVKGLLLSRTWRYSPITTIITKDKIVYVPKVVEVEKLVKTPQNGFYASLIVGGNEKAFMPGAGLDYITKKRTQIGYMYQRLGTDNFHSVRIGIGLFKKSP